MVIILYAAAYALRFWPRSTQLATLCTACYARHGLSLSVYLITLYTAVTLYAAAHALCSWSRPTQLLCTTKNAAGHVLRSWLCSMQLVTPHAIGYALRSRPSSTQLTLLVTLYATCYFLRIWLRSKQVVTLCAGGNALRIWSRSWCRCTQLVTLYAAGIAPVDCKQFLHCRGW